jgi:hypothetical protein
MFIMVGFISFEFTIQLFELFMRHCRDFSSGIELRKVMRKKKKKVKERRKYKEKLKAGMSVRWSLYRFMDS